MDLSHHFVSVHDGLIKKLDLDDPAFDSLSVIQKQIEFYEGLVQTLFSEDLHIVYKHTCQKGKVYIGITKNLPNDRWNSGMGYITQPKFAKAIMEQGWSNIKHEIIAVGLSREEALKLENDLILKYRSNEPEYGYNTKVDDSEADSKKKSLKKKSKEKVIAPVYDPVTIVHQYLERKLPSGWSKMSMQQRRDWLNDKSNKGSIIRETVCCKEIWAEAFGRNPDHMKRIDSLDIKKIMDNFPEWERPDNKRVLDPIYDRQRVYVRKNGKERLLRDV